MKNLLPILGLLLPFGVAAQTTSPAPHPLTARDLQQLRDVRDAHFSPDGQWVTYVVSQADTAADKGNADVWMARYNGTQNLRVTTSPDNETAPRFSPDGLYLSFLSSRGEGEDGHSQLWLLNRNGGEAEKVTKLKGSVSDYVWAPDGKRLALIIRDADPDSLTVVQKAKKKTPPVIVVDRFQFKQDVDGYLNKQRQHLYVFDVAARKLSKLTSGIYDEYSPAWSPDGKQLVFVSKRGDDPDRHDNFDLYAIDATPGAQPRQLTTSDVADSAPSNWSGRPAWSPDGKQIAFVEGGPKDQLVYGLHQLAVIPAAGGTPKLLTSGLDRNTLKPQWSKDGKSLYFLLEDDRAQVLARVPANGGKVERVLDGKREITEFEVGPKGQIVVVNSEPQLPDEVFAFEKKALRPISKQNDAWLKTVQLGATDPIQGKSKDGTLVSGFLVKPVGYQAGQKYPTVLRIHGGPVSQFAYSFSPEWQILAAHGYAVVASNPRGSSGRGLEYCRAIYADWGNKDSEDALSVVDYAVQQGIADPARLGVGGWSYGGILTDHLIARDKRFKAATSGAGIANVFAGYGTDQYIRDYETELGTPWEHTDVWMRISYPFFHAGQISTPTLFLCGEKDFNVPLLNTEQMYQALQSLKVPTQLIIYPGQFHGINKPSYVKDRYDRYLAWYDKYLKAGTTTAGGQ
ncbi:Dipeptidyl aminopeptidase/acylaminoacyl peptidase [Hymenobacter gelipurpurascens]|uniref:Dipeptidyl aminopeptidase/acylaminoacyl peptidase n=1 Tax=Hymenobacter gelipurpurascens TaxID=89968 RepID=A0A212TR03_9BACT|nr:S9 family peptidase [Hymenobacter gelipurpurascens]SNC68447.1 Dipeptidyl aminopeptidase/acylaminoacyl peptidase [Hymenobacter gelipurpurascens]